MRLRSAVVLICLALSLIATFYGAYSRFNVAEQIIVEETYYNFEKISELKKFQIENFVESEKEKLEILKSCPAILNILYANKEGKFDSNLYFQAKNRIGNLNKGVGVFDIDGIVVVAENNPPGTNYSGIVLGEYDFKILYYYDHTRKNNFLGILSPIFDGDTKEKIGYVGFDIELEELNNFVNEGGVIGKTGEIYLIDSDKLLMTPSRFFDNGQFMQKVDTVNSQNCFDNKNGGIKEFLNYRGEDSIGTHRYLPFINWCLIVEIEKGELLDEIMDKLLLSSILISLAIIGSLVILGFFLGEYLEKTYLKKKRKSKKVNPFLKKLSKISFLSYFIFAFGIAIIYFALSYYSFKNFEQFSFFKIILNLFIFLVSFMILAFGLRMKNSYTKNFILGGSILICFKRLLSFPFLEQELIMNSSIAFLWYPIFLLEYLGFFLLLLCFGRMKNV